MLMYTHHQNIKLLKLKKKSVLLSLKLIELHLKLFPIHHGLSFFIFLQYNDLN